MVRPLNNGDIIIIIGINFSNDNRLFSIVFTATLTTRPNIVPKVHESREPSDYHSAHTSTLVQTTRIKRVDGKIN